MSFNESFTKAGPATYRSYRDTQGRKRTVKIVAYKPSENFDVEANFNLLLTMERTGQVKAVFADKVLIRELFRHAESAQLSESPEVRAMLAKLSHVRSHDDHLHIRLHCPPADVACVNEIAPRPKRRRKPVRRPIVKKAAAKKTPASPKTAPAKAQL